MQYCPSNDLHIVVAQTGGTDACFAYGSKYLGHYLCHQARFQLEQVLLKPFDFDFQATAHVTAGCITLGAVIVQLSAQHSRLLCHIGSETSDHVAQLVIASVLHFRLQIV